MPSLLTILRDVPDPRSGNAQRHDLLDILTIALVASVCGAQSCVDFRRVRRGQGAVAEGVSTP